MKNIQSVPPVFEATPEEEVLFTSLRAATWDDFFGQEQIKESLKIAITAAKQRKEPVDHTLFYGPPCLGKTTLSHLIAKEMQSNIRMTSGTALSKVGDLAAILTNLEPNDVLFIDEIHRLPKAVEETLYPAMEDYALDIVIGKGPSARTIRLDLPKFTLVGATTRFGLLSGPFRDRFGVIHRLEYYSPEKLVTILHTAAKKLVVEIDRDSLHELANRSRGTPRIALKLLKRVRDYAQVKNGGKVTLENLHKALDLLQLDVLGLDHSDRRLLETMIKKYNGGPVGIATLAASLNEDPGTLEEVVEPYLLQVGFIKRTPQGRVATEHAYHHLKMQMPKKEKV
ncbi:MAG: Holliday junction branch migration DNA helicase RuvB [Candidatus Pacebacteria bacterium]|nr:Holliday junction branch migration DNA helicase RuvB [Candidatus Paceibacterota bacterium]